jgi:hypothetical protein
LPIDASEIGSHVAHRLYDFLDIVDGVTDELVRRKTVTLRGLKSVGGKGYYGRYMKSLESGHVVQLGVLIWSWAYRYPSPFWLRIYQPDPEIVRAWEGLVGTPGIALVDSQRNDGWLSIALQTPLWLEADIVQARLADAVASALAVLPLTTADKPAEIPQEGQLEEPEGTET